MHKCAFPQTCDVDLDLQAAVLGDRNRRPLGDHTALDGLGHEGGGAGGGGHVRVAAAAAVTPLATLVPTRGRLCRPLQEVPHQLEPVEDEEDPEVVEDHGEAGGLTRGPKRSRGASRLRLRTLLAPPRPLVPVVQLQLQRRSVGARFRRLEDAVEHVGLPSVEPGLSSAGAAEASVVGQQGVRHQVDRLGSVRETLKQQLGLHEVKSSQRKTNVVFTSSSANRYQLS